jgi:hypothetical protein
MKKLFCDLCGNPAIDELRVEHQRPIGEPYSAFKTENDGSGCNGKWQCKIVVTPTFTFRDHERGYGGPPDLCASCAHMLLLDLANAANLKYAANQFARNQSP